MVTLTEAYSTRFVGKVHMFTCTPIQCSSSASASSERTFFLSFPETHARVRIQIIDHYGPYHGIIELLSLTLCWDMLLSTLVHVCTYALRPNPLTFCIFYGNALVVRGWQRDDRALLFRIRRGNKAIYPVNGESFANNRCEYFCVFMRI